MEYTTPNELSKQYWKSLKTIYNRLQKYPDKIRTKKEFWKTIVNCKDFENLFQNYKNVTNTSGQKPQQKANFETNPNFEKLQNEYNFSLQKIQNLEKYNSTLSNQVKEYALLYTEEKKEKKEYQDKLDLTNQKFNDKIESFASEKIRLERKYYILFSFFAIAGIIIIRMQLPEIFEAVSYFFNW